MSNSDSDCNST